jgi:hypothetical protein
MNNDFTGVASRCQARPALSSEISFEWHKTGDGFSKIMSDGLCEAP